MDILLRSCLRSALLTILCHSCVLYSYCAFMSLMRALSATFIFAAVSVASRFPPSPPCKKHYFAVQLVRDLIINRPGRRGRPCRPVRGRRSFGKAGFSMVQILKTLGKCVREYKRPSILCLIFIVGEAIMESSVPRLGPPKHLFTPKISS